MIKKSKPESEMGYSNKVTASDVAKQAGVSKWTVSRAFSQGASISPKAREKVLKAATELGYRPNLLARSLTKRKTRLIGLVVDEMDNPNLLRLINETSLKLQKRGYLSMLINISELGEQEKQISLADQFQIDGLIFLGTALTEELVDLAQKIQHIPLIVLYRNSNTPHIQVVSTDGYSAGIQIATFLARQGYQRIGYMSGPVSESTQLNRLEGFRDGLAKHDLEVDLILEAGHYGREAGFNTLNQYLATLGGSLRIEALFCENDILAIGAIDALHNRGNSNRIGIVGFDDIDEASSPHYALTTYRQPLEQLVDEAIRRLEGNKEATRQLLLPGELIIRQSH
ncbi:LacI family DNA-binding transcriptional regulator [Halomonas sp. HAL1]|jgi:LacI family transcriptional regulator|uniref:LacI family DNA-binding transcriptional regulator n=1 Tax=Halomonas sp. HAL1 TaxID=550984 RepID=UPI00022D29B9|nr:LacI family DNA-binding transcriptional regulator [Halomonas sp. HAL1]EHA14716.1 LacI family transcriptional regulator [Halomonas sp. HAL1]WKV93423.1 LacI family DNA-binding transcriptional regulator [Halomonas sp. HAL1]|tara:strand:+ start:622 stop:1644 length:1023 start_codon:yes stop_codon:yes gene_type:complete